MCVCMHVCAHTCGLGEREGRRVGGGSPPRRSPISAVHGFIGVVVFLHRRVCRKTWSWVLLSRVYRNRESLPCAQQPLGPALSAPRGFPRSCRSPGLGGEATGPPCQPMPGLWLKARAAAWSFPFRASCYIPRVGAGSLEGGKELAASTQKEASLSYLFHVFVGGSWAGSVCGEGGWSTLVFCPFSEILVRRCSREGSSVLEGGCLEL